MITRLVLLKRLLLFPFLVVVTSIPSHCQTPSAINRDIPVELQATDPEIRTLLEESRSSADIGNYDVALSKAETALDLAETKGLVGDKALAEQLVAIGYFGSGKLEDSFKFYRASLQDAIDSSNLVLQADALVALSTLPQLQGNLPGALERLGMAHERANQSKNPYIRARVLGELGKLQIASGQIEQGRKSVEEALNIDKVNGYDFEPLHSVYAVYAILSQPKPDFPTAIVQLDSASELAIQKNNYIALVLVQNALGAVYVHNGELEKGIATLEAIRNGKIMKDGQAVELEGTFRAATDLPFMKTTLLEALAQGYEAAHESDKALQAWNEIYSLSIGADFTVAEAEAASKIAAIYKSKNDVSNALSFFSKSIDTWRTVGNDEQLSQVLIAKSQLLIQSGKGEEAIPLEQEILQFSEKDHNRLRQFFTNVVLAGIYRPAGKFQEARKVLEDAQTLIKLGPTDSEIDNNAVREMYAQLADVYRALQQPTRELFAIMRAVQVTRTSKDQENESRLTAYLSQRVRELNVYDQAQKAITEGRLVDVLTYSEVIFVYQGSPKDWSVDENWIRISNVPYQLVEQPGGPEALVEILSQIGSLPTFSTVPILQALSTYFILTDPKPNLAEQYALEVNSIVSDGKAPDVWKARSICTLAIAYAQEKKLDLAKDKSVECMALAEKAGDVSSKNFANLANVFAQLAANNPAAAESSLEYVLANSPQDPEIHLQLAIALVSKDQYEKGVAEFNQAIKLIEGKRDVNAEAFAFARMALALGSIGSSQYEKQQLEYLKSAEGHYKQANNASGEANADIFIGEYYVKAGDHKAALTYFQQGQTLGQQAHDSRASAQAALNLGTLYNALHDYQKAGEFHRRASATYHEIGDGNLEALTLLFVGQDLQSQKDFDSALKIYLDAESIASRSSTPITRYWIQNTLEQFYYQAGEFDKALTSARSAVQLATLAGDKRTTAQAYIVLAGLCEILGQWEDAATAANQALEIFNSLKDRHGAISSYAELASIYGSRESSFRDFDKALAYYSEATKLGGNLQSDLVEIYSQNGRLSEAINAAKSAIQECIKNHNVECQAGGLADLAEVERKKGDLAAAASSLKEARRFAPGIKDVYFQGSLLYREAGQLRAEGHLEQAKKTYQELISLIERVKGQGDVKSQRTLSENYGYIYDELSLTLYAMSAGKSDPDRTRLASLALQYTETNKAREFAGTWGRTFITELRRTLPSYLQEKERSLVAERDQPLASTAVEEAKPKLVSVEKEMASFVDGLRLTHPQYAAVAYPQPVTLESIPLRKGETLVEFKVTDESTLVWVIRNVTGNKVELVDFYQVSKSRQWFEERVLNLRSALNSGKPYQIEQIDWHNSEELFNELFPGSLWKTLSESTSIVFVPDDVLSVLPLELLSPEASKGHFPLLSIPTTYYPSAAALQLARTAKHVEIWQESFLGIGDPITSPEDVRYASAGVLSTKRGAPSGSTVNPGEPELGASDLAKMTSRGGLPTERLPKTATEVKGIAKLFQNQGQTVEVRLGPAATKDGLTGTDLTRFRYLHFATHGILPGDSNIPEPALLLSYDGSGSEHMLLSMSEVLGLKIHADTVVLSACNTGSGNVMHAEGVMSLGRAFMAAGAESVTVSLWQVSDDSTQMLMEEYYKNLIGGKSKAEALSIARSYLFANGYKNPYFWAPFVLIGD
jgi:tetratricopeptide (TPR) repeat protein